jgi:hypothetical protein
MISAAKLKYLTNINADEITELLLDAGYEGRDEPIINTHFDGAMVGTENLYFSYQASYVHVDGGLQFANIVVTYDINHGTISADFAS